MCFGASLRGGLRDLVLGAGRPPHEGHGTGDDNVHYQGTEKLANALVAEGRDFTLMAYPNRSHSVSEGKGTTRHLYGLMTRYLQEKTPPGPR